MAILSNLAPLKTYWHAPAPIFVARVNLTSPVYPIQDIPFDGITVGAYTDLGADMFFTLGDATHPDIYGRGRLRAAPTATVLKVGRASEGNDDGQLSVVDNAYIRVYPDYRVHAKIPVIGKAPDYIDRKDTDIPVGDLTTEPPPIANMGPDRARSIDATTGKITISLDGTGSFAVADGATITGHAWSIQDGTILFGGTVNDAVIVVEFPAGVRYVSLTVTDSNAKTHTTRRLVLADDPADSLCVSGMQVQSITRNQQGSTARLRVLQELPRADYPDGGHVLLWEDRDPAIYGDPDPADYSNIFHDGWHQTDQASSRALETHLQRETTLVCVDVLGRLDSLPGFPQRVEVPTAADLAAEPSGPGMNWGYMPAANMDKFTCYLIHWHSTADGVADFRPSGTWDEYPFVLFDSGGDSLYNQLQRQASRIVPDHNFTSDQFGRMAVVVNPQFQPLADRAAATNNITAQSWSEISFDYQRPPRVHTTRGSALLVQTAWVIDDADEKQLLTPLFSIAPGTAPGQGARENTLGERLAKSQADLNDCVGQHHAYDNARYGNITVTLNANSSPWSFDPATFTFVNFTVPAEAAPQRGIDFVTTRALVKEVTAEYSYSEEGTSLRGRVTLEVETVGLPALTEVSDDALPVGEQPVPIPPPTFGLIEGQSRVAGIGQFTLYRTSDFQTPSGSGGPTWVAVNLTTDDTILSWVVDPFSPGYLRGVGAVNGWLATATALYRVTNLFGATSCSVIVTFAETALWRTIQASFGTYFGTGLNPWLVCVSYYGDLAGHTGAWATHSVDGGATWAAEVQVSPYYDALDPALLTPIGLYASPKTPGLAYTAAYLAPAGDMPLWAIADGFSAITEVGPYAASYSVTTVATSTGSVHDEDQYLWLLPPANTKRVKVTGTWSSDFVSPAGFDACGSNVDVRDDTATTLTDNLVHSVPGQYDTATTSGSFEAEVTFAGFATNDWPRNSVNLLSSSNAAFRFRAYSSAAGATAVSTTTVTVTVVEIELDDGTIYTPANQETDGFVSTDWGSSWTALGGGLLGAPITPGEGFAGAIHLPWPANAAEDLIFYGSLTRTPTRAIRLMRATGATTLDISPTSGGRWFGVNNYGFTARTFDNDRAFVLVAGIGNDSSGAAADDLAGVWISVDGGDTWSNVLAPVAISTTLRGFEAAFGGGAGGEQIIFVWGGLSSGDNAILYSDDGGATLDSRKGNLAALSATPFRGIAGGVVPT